MPGPTSRTKSLRARIGEVAPWLLPDSVRAVRQMVVDSHKELPSLLRKTIRLHKLTKDLQDSKSVGEKLCLTFFPDAEPIEIGTYVELCVQYYI